MEYLQTWPNFKQARGGGHEVQSTARHEAIRKACFIEAKKSAT